MTWTNRGEVDTIYDPVSGVTFDYEWTASSLVDSVTTGTGLARDYSYDTAGRVTADVLSNTAGVVSTMGYGYDTGSNMVTKVVGIPANPGFGTHTYTYDHADRLESWTFGTETTAYGYDASGNRTQAGSDVYSFDARNRLITGPEGSYSHTARGTLVSVVGAETHTYDFDSLDRLVAFDAVNYTYDGLDRVATRGTDTFTYSGLAIDPTTDGQFTYGRTPGGNLLSITDGTETVLVGRDRHGDVTHLYNQTGVIQHSRLYDPFGEVTTTAGTQVGQVGFQGDWTDPSSEHVWMGARWYDGGWATFLSRDTVFGELSTSVSLNRYTYAFNNPLSFWDPDGRCPDYLGSINGGSALAQCKTSQQELAAKVVQTRSYNQSIDRLVREAVGEFQSANKTPRPSFKDLGYIFVGAATTPIWKWAYDRSSPRERGEAWVNRFAETPKALSGAVKDPIGTIKSNATNMALLYARAISDGNALNAAPNPAALVVTDMASQVGHDLWACTVTTGAEGAGACGAIAFDVAAVGATSLALKALRGLRASKAPSIEPVELKPYEGPGGGHHVPAKSAFDGAPGYDINSALAIPNSELARLGVIHARITGAQARLYSQFAARGETLSWEAIARIEQQALVAGGMDSAAAASVVNRAIAALKSAGVEGPTRIPWGGGR